LFSFLIFLQIIHTPGHTPSCISYYLPNDAIFVGDTIFMPDSGTARCDFPNGSAQTLWGSLKRVLSLPESVRVFVGHDYAPGGREIQYETTIGDSKQLNKHVKEGIAEAEFLEMRTTRDKGLSVPRLLFPSIQINMIAGHFPEADSNEVSYIKLPLTLKK
jgi:glyoxylase-like metal-dependent hydrolase (beta-lactamase superfamily II)